ncbi:MAG: Minf_1886 family protein [Thermoguttaceae bacterium]
MLDPAHPIAKLLQEDRRYPLDAYVFLFEALQYAQNVLHLGQPGPTEPEAEADPPDESSPEHHVTGQELCEAIRQFALEQYGYMAQTVLNNWGIRRTGDFGEIVYNLIRIGQMRKTPADSRDDFDDVYDFDVALKQGFKITAPDAAE